MKIETKFNVGDTVWVATKRGYPKKVEVWEVLVIVRQNETIIKYLIIGFFTYREGEVFATKEELLDSLKEI